MKAIVAITAAALAATPLMAQDMSGQASLMDTSGAEVGTVTISSTASGIIHIGIEGMNMPEGEHAIHLHQVGQCEGDFSSAGDHLAGDMQHGIQVEGGPHPGDLPNLHVGSDGSVMVENFKANLTMDQVFDEDGSAVIVHSGADDYESQPSGDAGDRVACGVIEQG